MCGRSPRALGRKTYKRGPIIESRWMLGLSRVGSRLKSVRTSTRLEDRDPLGEALRKRPRRSQPRRDQRLAPRLRVHVLRASRVAKAPTNCRQLTADRRNGANFLGVPVGGRRRRSARLRNCLGNTSYPLPASARWSVSGRDCFVGYQSLRRRLFPLGPRRRLPGVGAALVPSRARKRRGTCTL
jgi:hypothetical protein